MSTMISLEMFTGWDTYQADLQHVLAMEGFDEENEPIILWTWQWYMRDAQGNLLNAGNLCDTPKSTTGYTGSVRQFISDIASQYSVALDESVLLALSDTSADFTPAA